MKLCFKASSNVLKVRINEYIDNTAIDKTLYVTLGPNILLSGNENRQINVLFIWTTKNVEEYLQSPHHRNKDNVLEKKITE